eukprot:gene7442-8861_t
MAAQLDEPETLVCPITGQVFLDPVFVPEAGNTYEREALEQFWEAWGARDPLSRVALRSREVHTNQGKRREVQAFLDKHPAYTPQGWANRHVAPARNASRRRPLYDLVYEGLERLPVVLLIAFFVFVACSDTEAPDTWERVLL